MQTSNVPVSFSRDVLRRLVWGAAVAALALLVLLACLYNPSTPTASVRVLSAGDEVPTAAPAQPVAPPWHHGAANARFTLILYADLECPYCSAYLPRVMAWIDQHPDTRLQWHHLPLPAHDPAASRLATLAECAGETAGPTAFWNAVTWIYQHTRGEGQGLPEQTRFPEYTDALQRCLDGQSAMARVQLQAREGTREGIAATPTLRMRDETTGQSLLLAGPVEADALLSALDLLTARDSQTSTAPEQEP